MKWIFNLQAYYVHEVNFGSVKKHNESLTNP